MVNFSFGDISLDENFLFKISKVFFHEKQSFENLEDFFRYFYYEFGEQNAKNLLFTRCNVELLDEKSYDFDIKNFIIRDQDINFYQKNLFLIYKIDSSSIKILIDSLSDEILENIQLHFAHKYSKIDFILCEKNFLIHKICDFFHARLVQNSIHNLNPSESAKNLNFLKKKSIFKILISITCFLFLSFSSLFFILAFIIFSNLCYSASIVYKIFLSFGVKKNQPIVENYENDIEKYPIYTILLPIYKENDQTIKQLIKAIEYLDYPQYKLDVKILVENDDEISKQVIRSIADLKYNFNIIKIPKYAPQTKAKACNYAINFSKGEFLVIYDSDDIPSAQQLKIALYNFKIYPDATCLQARLNSYNYNENFLTKFYSIEFDLWYKVFLPRMNSLHLPTTFGGTSNHFRIQTLKSNMWDSWNVTEDADLGIRWYLKNLGEVKIIDSQTLEEAPISISAWINQRSRWIKGFLQTYFIHKDHRGKKFNLWLNFFIFLPIASQILFFPIVFEFIVLKFHHQSESQLFLASKISLYSFIINYFLQIIPISINAKKFLWRPTLLIFFFPLYSIALNIISSYKALWQLFSKPFFWEKTKHGVSSIYNSQKK